MGVYTSPTVVPENELNQFLDVANKVADAAGEIIRKYFRNKFEVHGMSLESRLWFSIDSSRASSHLSFVPLLSYSVRKLILFHKADSFFSPIE